MTPPTTTSPPFTDFFSSDEHSAITTPTPTWLPAFHQQVAARSPRLAACFVGAAAPGALRWSARLDLRSGRAGDHRFAPTLEAAPPTADQQACLARALAEPPYQIEVPAPPDLPVPVSLVIEF
ncbi:hypothetical protein L6R53_18195 [Myxococcota bacterium]|nr:hypothetical protein [Myxococcota bacterium]